MMDLSFDVIFVVYIVKGSKTPIISLASIFDGIPETIEIL
jgi:hypothetical protein